MIGLAELVKYTSELLDIDQFQDYCPNGLQVEGRQAVETLVSGVTASQSLVNAAVKAGAHALLVHHGYFWKDEDPRIVGMKRKRLGELLAADINLLAYHLPLDAHPEYGNNRQLANVLHFHINGGLVQAGSKDIGLHGDLNLPMPAGEFIGYLSTRLGREPLHIPGCADQIKTIAWCSGAAQDYIEAAADLGLDAFLTGEASERTVHVARERGIHFFAAGHHATERYGVCALGDHLAAHFGLNHRFIDIDNPV